MDDLDDLKPAEQALIERAVRKAFAKGRAAGERSGYDRGREDARQMLAFTAQLAGSTHAVLKALDEPHTPTPTPEPEPADDAPDLHAALAEAMVEAAHQALEAGDDPRHAVEALRALAGDPAELARVLSGGDPETGGVVAKAVGAWLVRKAWDESAHPRGRGGHFIGKDRLEDAKSDPKVAAQLRKEVKPEDAHKLEKVLAGGDSPGRTKRGQAAHEAGQRRADKDETRKRGEKVLAKLKRAGDLKGDLTADDLHDLADHLTSEHVTVGHLREVRRAMQGGLAQRVGFGGAKAKADMVAALVSHARREGLEARMREMGVTDEEAAEMRRAVGVAPKEPIPSDREPTLEELETGVRPGGGRRAQHLDPHSRPYPQAAVGDEVPAAIAGAPKEAEPEATPADALPDADALAAAPREAVRTEGGLTGGSAQSLYRATVNGKQYAVKSAAKNGPVGEKNAAERAHAEELSSQLAKDAGVSVPAAKVVDIGGKPHVVSEWADGTPLSRGDAGAALKGVKPGEVSRMALFDFATGYNDNHLGNYLVGKDGTLHGIDRESSFGDGSKDMAFHLDENKLLKAAAGAGGDKARDAIPLPREQAARMADVADRAAEALAHDPGRAAMARERAGTLRKLAELPSPTVGDLIRLSSADATPGAGASPTAAPADSGGMGTTTAKEPAPEGGVAVKPPAADRLKELKDRGADPTLTLKQLQTQANDTIAGMSHKEVVDALKGMGFAAPPSEPKRARESLYGAVVSRRAGLSRANEGAYKPGWTIPETAAELAAGEISPKQARDNLHASFWAMQAPQLQKLAGEQGLTGDVVANAARGGKGLDALKNALADALAAKHFATPAAPPAKSQQQIADEVTARRRARPRPGGVDDANPTPAEVDAASRPAAPAPDMAMLDQQPDAVAPGSRTGDAVARKETQQAKRSGTPPAPEAPDLAKRLDARHRGTRHSEVNAMMRDAAALTPEQASAALRSIGQTPGADPRRELVESIHERQGSKVRQGLAFRPGSPDAAEFDAMADEKLTAPDELLGARPAKAARAPEAKPKADKPKAAPAKPPATTAGKAVADAYARAAAASDADIEAVREYLKTMPTDEVQRVAAAIGHEGPATAKDVLDRIADRRGSAVRGKLIDRPTAPKPAGKPASDARAAHKAASPLVRDHLDAALHNAGTTLGKVATHKDRRDLAAQLASAHGQLHGHPQATPADHAAMEAAIRAMVPGIEKAHAAGDVVPFDGSLHDAPGGGVFTGDRVRVVRPGWVLPGEGGAAGKPFVAGKATAEKASGNSPTNVGTAVDKPTTVGNTTRVEPPKSGGGNAGGGKMEATEPRAKATIPAGHAHAGELEGGAVVAKDPRTQALTTHFAPGEPEKQAKRLAKAIGDAMDYMGYMIDVQQSGGQVQLGHLVGQTKALAPGATNSDVLAALSHLRKTRALDGHAINEVRFLTTKEGGTVPLYGSKDAATASLWEDGRARQYWMLPQGKTGKDVAAAGGG